MGGDNSIVLAAVYPLLLIFPYMLMQSSFWSSITEQAVSNIYFGVMGNYVLCGLTPLMNEKVYFLMWWVIPKFPRWLCQ